MRVGRLVLVLAVVTLGMGAFGAVVGGLAGYAMPREIPLSYETTSEESGPDGGTQRVRQKSAEFGVAREGGPDHMAGPGAALGAALGLLLGACAALPVALADQLLLAWRARKRD